MENVVRLAFIGYGEVGQTWSRGLLARQGVRLTAYDLVFDGPDGAARVAAAKTAGVEPAADAAAASRQAAIVISAVTAAAAPRVAAEAASYLRPGQIFFDINSTSPATKRAAAACVAAAGAEFVEGAVMAPVAGPGIAVPILAGGREATATAVRLNALGMNVTPVATEIGRASATKLCRSIMVKGIEALILDCAEAAREHGVEGDVWSSLAATFPGIDWPALAVTMAERVRRHGVRRAEEMREAGEMLRDLDADPALCAAVADAHERFARKRGRA